MTNTRRHNSKHKDTAVIVITSDVTWPNLSRYCFNDNFCENRDRFDLCVVLNGSDENAVGFIKRHDPMYFLIRPNIGMDPAALDLAIKTLPIYEFYIILHDDHWFPSANWFNYLMQLLINDLATEAYGNLVVSSPYATCTFDNEFRIASGIIMKDKTYETGQYPYFLQGMAGIFRGIAIQKLLERDGVPHVHNNTKKIVEFCERLFSYALLDLNMRFKQIPPDFEIYLRHRENNSEIANFVARKYPALIP